MPKKNVVSSLGLARRKEVRLILLSVLGLALSRLVYEVAFPHLLWLARPFPILLLAVLTSWLGYWLISRFLPDVTTMALLPLLLNLLPFFQPAITPVQSRFVFGASVWLTAVFITKQHLDPPKWGRVGVLFLNAALLPVYLRTMARTVGMADTFEFQVVAPKLGIVHPTGYPLYLLLGKLFTLFPVGTVAWRLNIASMVYGLVATSLLFVLAHRLWKRPLPALLGALLFGLTPTFWSQAIVAEVYTLHAVFIGLVLLVAIGRLEIRDWRLVAAFLIGLGLTNHLTTLFLIPPVMLTFILSHNKLTHSSALTPRFLIKTMLVFLAPLILYAYLPLRWLAVVGEPMGVARFVDWVIGGRFQNALHWLAWLQDPTRYSVIGRLFLHDWGWWNLGIALLGLIFLFAKGWRVALILLATWFGFTFYALNYYVPDLAVFIIPAQFVVGLWWISGISGLRLEIENRLPNNLQSPISNLLIALLLIPALLTAVNNLPLLDQSQNDGQTEWGAGVLGLPLAQNAAILADSSKHPPLYYLQQAEGLRPDLDIMVLPDEAAYRAELDGRIAQGQTVYLARFLPGLEGIYHLRSMGPLTEVSKQPLTQLPETAVSHPVNFDSLQLLGYQLEETATVDAGATAVTLFWQTEQPTNQPTDQPLLVYTRWNNGDGNGTPIIPSGQHPANNDYPTNAWKADEIVSDYQLLPHPVSHLAQQLTIEVALAVPFTPHAQLDWQAVAAVGLPPTGKLALERPLTAQIGSTLLGGVQFPAQIRPQTPLPVTVTGYGTAVADLQFSLQPIPHKPTGPTPNLQPPISNLPFSYSTSVDTDLPNGRYQLIVQQPQAVARCGWAARTTAGCVLGEVEISGVPLPDGAINFNDQISLLAVEMPTLELEPGGSLALDLTWQSLQPIQEDYTIFIQILDAQDRLVGQVDAWPLQGTFPTTQWTPGETVHDPYTIQLDGDLPPGEYRLLVGWYLLETLQRLPVLDENGTLLEDKHLLHGLYVR